MQLTKTLLLFAGLSLACTTVAPVEPPTVVIHNARVWPGLGQPLAEAIALRGPTVLAVGSSREMLALAGPDTKRVDAGGQLVTPAYREAHSHSDAPPFQPMGCLGAGFTASPATLGGPTKAEVEACVRSSVARYGPGVPLLGIVGDSYLREPERGRAFLDPLSPNNPVILVTWSGHQLAANSAALAMGGVHPRLTPDHPWGGWERDSSGELTGVVNEYDQLRFHRLLGNSAPDSFYAGVYAAYDERAVQLGWTSVQSLPISISSDRERRVLAGMDLKLDWETVCFPESESEPCEGYRTVKYLRSGTPVEWRTPMYEGYRDIPTWLPAGWRGIYNLDNAALARVITRARESGQRVMLHVLGDEEADTSLEVVEALGAGGEDIRFEHGYLTTDAGYERAKAMGVTVVQEPTHTILKPWYAGKYGPEVAAHAHPMRSLVDRGVRLAFATDAFGTPGDPRVLQVVARTNPLGDPGEAVTPELALHLLTRAVAEAQGHSDRGSLTPGQRADLLVHSVDLLAADAPVEADVVRLNMQASSPIWDDGSLTPAGGW
jgi:hypothetical protein